MSKTFHNGDRKKMKEAYKLEREKRQNQRHVPKDIPDKESKNHKNDERSYR